MKNKSEKKYQTLIKTKLKLENPTHFREINLHSSDPPPPQKKRGGGKQNGGVARNGGLPYSIEVFDVFIFPLLTKMCYKIIA